MIIDEIVLHNFGVFKGQQTVTLTPPSKLKPIILFGGYNGTGKTTLLDAIQLALYGKFSRCSNRGNLSYEEFLSRSIHKSANPQEGASIELQFRHMSNGKEHIYRIRRIWSQKRKSIHEYVEVIKDGTLDKVLTDDWYRYVEEYIPSRISNLFFFDGEKIEEYANAENASQILHIAIHSLLGLDIIDQLYDDLSVLEQRGKISFKNDTEREVIENAKTEIEELDKRRSELVQARASLQNELEQEEKYYKNIEKNFRLEGGELFEKKEEIEALKFSNKEHLTSTEEELRELAVGPAPLLMVIDMLQAVELQDHKEELACQTQTLIDTLKGRDRKLLEIAQQNHVPEIIINNLNNFLTEDRDNRMKDAQTECYLDIDNEARKSLKTLLENILPAVKSVAIELSNKADKLQANLDDIDRKLAGIPEEDSIAPLIREREKGVVSIDKIKARIEFLDNEIAQIVKEREQKHAWFTSQLEMAVKEDFYREDTFRIIHHSELVRETLKKFHTSIIMSNADRIGQLIFESFRQLIRKQSLIKEIFINPDTYVLELRGSDGKILSPERLSAGERQLLAISILWGLARASARPLPTAIDTPLGRLDSSHRNHIVERYFPYVSHQVLLFSTDEEISKRYFEKLKPYIGNTYLLEYDDINSATQIREGYFW